MQESPGKQSIHREEANPLGSQVKWWGSWVEGREKERD